MTAIRVRMDQLYPDPLNRPAGSGNQELEALAETIRALGVLIPPLVEPIDGRPGCFRIKDGRRRYAAAELAGVEELEVIVRPAGAAPPKVTSALTTIVTSSHHTPHQAVELAVKFTDLAKAGMSPQRIAQLAGVPLPAVYSHLRLGKADPGTLEAARQGDLTLGSVRAAVSAAGAMRPGDAPAVVRRPRRPRVAKPAPPGYFGAGHPLAVLARAECARQDHPAAGRYGGVACGPCFELVIRADALRSPLGDPSEEITGPEDRWNDPRLVCGGGQA